MFPVVQQCENLDISEPKLIVVPTANAVDILPDAVNHKKYAYRLFQNTGANDIYISYGSEASILSYHFKVPSGTVWNVSVTQRVSAIALVAGSVSVVEMTRKFN